MCLQCGYQRELIGGIETQPLQADLKKVSRIDGCEKKIKTEVNG
jgi:hypothetical protein